MQNFVELNSLELAVVAGGGIPAGSKPSKPTPIHGTPTDADGGGFWSTVGPLGWWTGSTSWAVWTLDAATMFTLGGLTIAYAPTVLTLAFGCLGACFKGCRTCIGRIKHKES